jgi:hypothetical protein
MPCPTHAAFVLADAAADKCWRTPPRTRPHACGVILGGRRTRAVFHIADARAAPPSECIIRTPNICLPGRWPRCEPEASTCGQAAYVSHRLGRPGLRGRRHKKRGHPPGERVAKKGSLDGDKAGSLAGQAGCENLPAGSSGSPLLMAYGVPERRPSSIRRSKAAAARNFRIGTPVRGL